MATSFKHLGFFPFCVGVEPTFLTTAQGGSLVSAYNSVLKMSLRDAMALYWKAKSAKVVANFSWTGLLNFGPPFPEGIVETNFSLDVETELSFYNQSNKQNEPRERVCFNSQENEPLIAAEFAVGGGGSMEFYLTFFFDKVPHRIATTNASRAFVKQNDQQPKNPDNEVYVNMFFSCIQRNPNLYGGIRIINRPHQHLSGLTVSQVDVLISGNSYLAETVTIGTGVNPFTPPAGNFQIIINTIDNFV